VGACPVKYMGSKRGMLKNGLGSLLSECVPESKRFYDLFCGAGSVSGYVAQNFDVPVYASDLQSYAVALAAAQIEQTQAFDHSAVVKLWAEEARAWLARQEEIWAYALEFAPQDGAHESWRIAVEQVRKICSELPDCFSVARAYGGYYYSLVQALAIDALRATLPRGYEVACLAALLDASSACAAAPGHTAQPFGTKSTALPHLATAWNKDVAQRCFDALAANASIVAKRAGRASCCEALELVGGMRPGDLAFVDPPYSEVQYSRFYHVLESISRGSVSTVSGVGRYPPLTERPQSKFCLVTESYRAFDQLMSDLARTGASAIVTFPAQKASNGLSGEDVEDISAQYFRVKKKKIASVFSTLGGNAVSRTARKPATELVLHLVPQ